MIDELSQSDLLHLREAAGIAGLDLPEIVLPQDHTVSLNGLPFHYLDWAGPGERTVLFLHGGHLTAHTWDLVCLALHQRFHCVALDARGHGDSAWAPDGDYSREAHTGDVVAVVDALGLDQFVLIGHSMGGGTAIGYASEHPDKLHALVLVDTGPRVDTGSPPPGMQRMQDFVGGPAELDSIDDFVERAVGFNPARHRGLLRRSLLHNLRQLPNGRWTWKYDREGLARRDPTAMAARQLALREAVSGITCPTLVLRGGRSDMFTDADAEYVAELLPNGRWSRVENAGHTVQGDNPRGLLDVLIPFLDDVAA